MRLNLFDTIDEQGWRLPVEIRIDEYPNGEPDVVVVEDSDAPVRTLPAAM